MKKVLFTAICLFGLLASGCVVVQSGNPVSFGEYQTRQICVIENPKVNSSFLAAYKVALEKKGFSVKVLPEGADAASCVLSSTYVGKWSWDFKPYMAYAKIVVYRDGVMVGDALYKAPRAGLAMTSKIYEETESKIAKMVDQLFPDTAASK